MSAPRRISWRYLGSSLQNSNFRRYLLGQSVSHAGHWFQQTAELWLILELTGSGTALGLHAVLRHGPTVLLGLYGGLLGDRLNRRKLLIVTQGMHALAAATLTLFAWLGSLELVLIYSVVLVQGIVNSIDNPLRRAFVRDLVDDGELSNAVSLNGIVSTVSRTIGPALAGIIIATAGAKYCFAINAISYAAVLVSLFTINVSRMRVYVTVPRTKGQIREGFRYAWRAPKIRQTLLLTAIISIFAWNWSTLLPVYASSELGGNAGLYGLLVSLLSVGALSGALLTSWMQRAGGKHLLGAAALVSGSLLVTAVAPTLVIAVIGLMVLGAAGTTFTIGAQTRLQLNVADAMNGRVMAMYSIGWVGSKPAGGMIGGWIVDLTNARMAFLFSGIAAAVTVVATSLIQRRRR